MLFSHLLNGDQKSVRCFKLLFPHIIQYTCKSYRYLNLDMVNGIVAVRGVPNNVNYKSNLGGEMFVLI